MNTVTWSATSRRVRDHIARDSRHTGLLESREWGIARPLFVMSAVCRTCTFENVDGMRECEMCGSTLAVGNEHWQTLRALEQERNDGAVACLAARSTNAETRSQHRRAIALSSSRGSSSQSAVHAAIGAIPMDDMLILLAPQFSPHPWHCMALVSKLSHEWRAAVKLWLAAQTAITICSAQLTDADLRLVSITCVRLLSVELSGKWSPQCPPPLHPLLLIVSRPRPCCCSQAVANSPTLPSGCSQTAIRTSSRSSSLAALHSPRMR